MKKKRIIIKDIPASKLDRETMLALTGGSEWKYMNIQRYFSFVERSVSNDTGWNLYGGGKG